MNATYRIIEKNDAEKSGAAYYRKLAVRYNTARLAVLAALVIFAFATLIFGRGSLKNENFAYFFRCFGGDAPASSDNWKIVYRGNADTEFALYKENLLVSGDGDFVLYDMKGRELISSFGENLDTFDASGKYLAAYRRGGFSGKLYNSFSEAYGIKTDKAISDISTSENGAFAVTTELDYGSAVDVYSGSFERIYSWQSADKCLMLAELSGDGEKLGLFAVGVDEGGVFSEALIKSLPGGDTLCDVRFSGEMPLGMYFLSGGNAALLTEKSLHIVNRRGREIKEMFFSGEVIFAGCDGKNIIVCLKNRNALLTDVCVISSSGKTEAEYTVNGRVYKMYIDEEESYLLSQGKMYICGEDVRECPIPDGVLDVLRLQNGKFILCFSDRAEIYEYEID